MSKKPPKAQASSARAASTAFGSPFGASTPAAFGAASSQLSYVTEPPDLKSISDPNVIVYFRNLTKKDSTTKAKALEDLQSHVSSLKEPVEDGVLEAWIKMYPRTSIDNAKSVRQSAHTLQGQLAAVAGKRFAKHMPKSVGAWLSGLYDSDRSVAEATQNSLRQVFNTPEKIQNIRKAYQQPILEYCRNAIDKESALTLSDERTVSPDDAQAKYSRVMSACISLLASLLANLQPDDLLKYRSDYESLFADRKLWDFAAHADPSIRRSVHRFLKTCVIKQSGAVQSNLEAISKSYLAVALNSDQVGSAYDYVDALALLTAAHPTIWTEHYKSKTSVDRRLRQFLKKGSQSGPREFWGRLLDLFRFIPKEVIPRDAADAAELLSALHSGVSRKDELRLNLESAYIAYLDIAASISEMLPEEDQRKLLSELVLPLVTQYLQPTPEFSQWNVSQYTQNLLTKTLSLHAMPALLGERWADYVRDLIKEIKTSAPEQSQDYEKSQNSVLQHATRLSTLQEQMLRTGIGMPLRSAISQGCVSLVSEALLVVKSRNGKPYGAAGAVAELLHRHRDLVLAEPGTSQQLQAFIYDDLPGLLLSPSCFYLVDILYSFSEAPFFRESFTRALKAILKQNDSSAKSKALEALLTSPRIPESFDLASSDPELQEYIKCSVQGAIKGSLEWDSFSRILQSSSEILSPATIDDILSHMTQALSLADQAPYALHGLRQIVKQSPSILKTFVSTTQGSRLMHELLLASESPNDEIAQGAVAVSTSIQTVLSAGMDSKQSIYDLIRQGLLEATPKSVSVETLVDLAKQQVKPESTWEEIKNILPTAEDWDSTLSSVLECPNSSLAIANPLGGAVYLVEPATSQSSLSKLFPKLPWDADSYSAAYRIAQYVTKLFKNPALFSMEKVPSALQTIYLCNIALTVQLVDDNLGLDGASTLWINYNHDTEADAISFMSDAQSFITQELSQLRTAWSAEGTGVSLLAWATDLLSKVESDTSPRAYYTARAYSVLIADVIERSGWKNSDTSKLQDLLKPLRGSGEAFRLLAFLNAFNEPLAASKSCERMCNEIVADLTGLDLTKKADAGLRQLIYLNTLLLSQEDIARTISKQRIIFFVKHVVPWLQGRNCPLPIRAEVCRSLTALLPLMGDIYGEHWSEILNALAGTWTATPEPKEDDFSILESMIPFVHASLKLYAQLRTLTETEDPNDDLLEAWKDTEQAVVAGLVNLLKHSQHFSDELHQPLKMVNDVLARQIAKVPMKHLDSTDELFPLLYVNSQSVQQTAFDILHKQIPAAQEQISIDVALEKTMAHLPAELLSLILEAPTVARLSKANFERGVPLRLRGYLLSWLLVFDHIEHASFKVKNDYVEHIREGDYLPGLLNFAFDFLGHAHNKPVDVSKLDITTYTPDMELPRRDVQWLLTHLYYLCLRHLPALTKSWYIDCKSRPIVVTLEPWTEKYISPPVIAAALQSVQEWSDSQAAAEPDSPFSIKVAPRAQEIIASYTIDEQTMAIRIALPPAFPLTNARIEGINRVAVNEQKWQSWIRTSLGAITIFNGNLIDALTTFKRNVDGAVKGQTECAICYSIVGSDKKLPDKRCQTCKNLFHGICLFKWFRTSGSSSCPLCRNPFNYG